MADALVVTELLSTVTAEGRLELSLADRPVGAPEAGELVVRVEAAPINPSDLALLLGPADLSTLDASSRDGRPLLTGAVPARAMASLAPRIGRPMPVGNEGAGTVVAAAPGLEAMIGRRVGIVGGGMFATHRRLPARDAMPLPDGASAVDGASMFVNPLTALGFVETMREGEHRGIVHTAAASNLGQMLNRICLADGVPLVNVVRSDAQAALLRDAGAPHVVNSAAPDYPGALAAAVAATGATVAFDAVGGGTGAARILAAMEAAASSGGGAYSRYGSDTFKQVFIYGALDPSPTVLDRWVGFSWSVGGWLLTPFLQRIGAAGVARLRARVADELTTTFASRYTATVSLAGALDPETVRAYARRATGEKYLIDPTA